jgi:type I restriction enzyme, S subunit
MNMIREVLLTDICSPKQHKTISIKDLKDNGYPVYGANGRIGFFSKYTHEHPTILITCRGATCGTINICEPKSYVNGNAMALDNLSSEVELKFLFYYLQKRGFNDTISGSAQPQITFQNLKNIQIPLPPLPVQQKIAAILDAADLHRRKTKTLIEKYDQLTQSIFLEMFGDPVKNEKGWEKYKVSALIQAVKKIDRNISNDEIDYVDISSIDNKSNRIVTTTKYLTDERPSRAQQILKKRDVLLSMVRPNLKNIAINQVDGFIASTGFFVFRVTNKLNHHYLFELLKTDSITNKLINITAGANYPAVRGTDIKNLLIPAPPLEMQELFSKKIESLEEQMMFAIESLHKSENLFNTLLQRAFKGELVS